MCIAIMKKEGSVITADTLWNCWQSNPDGAGFMYAEDGKLHMEKGFMKFKDFLAAYDKVGDKVAVLHFRIKTHGGINPENTHPFMVDNDLGFVHNGIIHNVDHVDKDMSDTYNFNEQILKPMNAEDDEFLMKDWKWNLLKAFIGSSKLIFLDSAGGYAIMNEKAGEWSNGVWYSNTSYKPAPVKQWQYPAKYTHTPYQNKQKIVSGDWVKVINKKWVNAPYQLGDIGLVDRIRNQGYIQVVFHEMNDFGDVVEMVNTLHESDLELVNIYGAL